VARGAKPCGLGGIGDKRFIHHAASRPKQAWTEQYRHTGVGAGISGESILGLYGISSGLREQTDRPVAL
jgi:hypothetical protein